MRFLQFIHLLTFYLLIYTFNYFFKGTGNSTRISQILLHILRNKKEQHIITLAKCLAYVDVSDHGLPHLVYYYYYIIFSFISHSTSFLHNNNNNTTHQPSCSTCQHCTGIIAGATHLWACRLKSAVPSLTLTCNHRK